MKTKKQLRTEAFKKRYSRLATKFGCSKIVAFLIEAISSFVLITGIIYLLNILWPMKWWSHNPLIVATSFAAFLTVIFFISRYLFPYDERTNGWIWKSKKNRREK